MKNNINICPPVGQHKTVSGFYRYNGGYTLIEILIVVTIISILSITAYNMYKGARVSASRQQVQALMIDISKRLGTVQAGKGYFPNVSLTDSLNRAPKDCKINNPANCMYDLSITVAGNGSGWRVTATPVQVNSATGNNQQKGDGALVLNSKGERCRDPSNDTTCNPAGNFNW